MLFFFFFWLFPLPFDEIFVLDSEITIILFWMSYRVNEDRIRVHSKCIEVHASACNLFIYARKLKCESVRIVD